MPIDPEHEKLYSPSAWSKRYGSTEITVYFNRLSEKMIRKARSIVSCKLDVPYGTTERTKYDVYGTDLPNDAPIFVFIHGGYWQEYSKDLAGFPIETLVSRGIKVINIGYDLCPSVTVSDIIGQVKTATDKILKDARDIGSECVWIVGHSAGAHLAASLLYDDEWLASLEREKCLKLIKGIILIGGIYNLEPLLGTSYNEALKLTSDRAKDLSLGSLDRSDDKRIIDMKVVVTVGECDSPIFVRESVDYAQKLIEFVDNVEFLMIRNNVDHFDIVENFTDPNFVLTKFIIDRMNGH